MRHNFLWVSGASQRADVKEKGIDSAPKRASKGEEQAEKAPLRILEVTIALWVVLALAITQVPLFAFATNEDDGAAFSAANGANSQADGAQNAPEPAANTPAPTPEPESSDASEDAGAATTDTPASAATNSTDEAALNAAEAAGQEAASGTAALGAAGAPAGAAELNKASTLAVVTYSIKVTGLALVSSSVNQQTWIDETPTQYDGSKDPQAALFDLLTDKSYTYSYTEYSFGNFLNAITNPDGVTLGPAGTYPDSSYWEFLINGESAQVGASSYQPQAGDKLEWRYKDGANMAFRYTFKIVGLELVGAVPTATTWIDTPVLAQPENNAYTDFFSILPAKGFTYVGSNSSSWGYSLDSISKPNGYTLGMTGVGSDWSYWSFYVNGEASMVGGSSYYPKPGDIVEWRYSDGAGVVKAENVNVLITGVDTVNGVNVHAPWIAQTSVQWQESKDAQSYLFELLADKGFIIETTDWGTPGSPAVILDAVTNPNGTRLAAGPVDGEYAYWGFFINGKSANVGAYAYVPQKGDLVEFRFLDPSIKSGPSSGDVVPDPAAPRPNYDAQASGFGANRVAEANTPVAVTDTELAFKYKFPRGEGESFVLASEILVVNGNVYIAFKQTLQILNGTTGEVIKETQLATEVGYSPRTLYTGGLIIVPLKGGRLQAFTADTLTCVWITESLGASHESRASIVEKDGFLYFGTVEMASTSDSKSGAYICVDAQTGALVWKFENPSVGYYNTGAVVRGDFVYLVDDSGTITALSTATGAVHSQVHLGTRIRSSLAIQGDYIYATDKQGRLWRVALSANGALVPAQGAQGAQGAAGEWANALESGADPAAETSIASALAPTELSLFGSTQSIKFANESDAMPVISNGKAYVVGTAADNKGVLAIVNLANFTMERQVVLPVDVRSTPLVITQGGQTYVYFTGYVRPGALMVYRVGDATASELYVPSGDDRNYCLPSVVLGANGMIYYANDAGVLFAFKPGTQNFEIIHEDDTMIPTTRTVISGGRTIVVNVDATGKTANKDAEASKDATSANKSSLAAGESNTPATDSAGVGATAAASGGLPMLPLAGLTIGVSGLLVCAAWVFSPQLSSFFNSLRAGRRP